MMLRWLLAALHLLALGIGLGAVWVRGRALASVPDRLDLERVFRSDTVWGLAAVLWIGTGVWRLLAGLEKPTAYYLHNGMFMAKMGFLLLILLLEIRPMLTLIRWRRQVGAGTTPDTRIAGRLARISFIQAALVVLMVLAATAMARGIGAGGVS
jgi:putative membrane protein